MSFGKKDGKKGDKKDGKKGDKKDGNEEDKSSEDDGENDAVDALLGFCEMLENALEKGLPDNTPSELLAIFRSVDPICEDAEEIAESESEDSDEKGDKSPKGSPKKLLVRLCEGLENGDIANTDPDYDSVFTDLEPVCDDVLEFVDSEMENEEGGDFGKKEGKKGDKKVGKKGDKKDGNEEDKSSEDDGENDAVDALLGFCEKLENAMEKGLPDDIPSKLLAIFRAVDPVCEDAEEIAESESEDSDEKGDKSPKGSPEKLLARLCEGLENGDIVNTDPDYDSVFTDLEPVCDDVLEFVDSETENEEGGDVKSGRKTQGSIQTFGKKEGKKGDKKGGKKKDEENDAVDALLNFCNKLDEAVEKGLPDDIPTELSDIFNEVGLICDDAQAID
ncbi:cylicin-1-like [Mercenaria mercenaria]|uniref:cylicin-1-like n=1 Tax=Mercenaria mercenaria TaxID=6596 RepID=UPI00234F3646|nr:cylicin-1-like [Mercenaria mercenaria]